MKYPNVTMLGDFEILFARPTERMREINIENNLKRLRRLLMVMRMMGPGNSFIFTSMERLNRRQAPTYLCLISSLTLINR